MEQWWEERTIPQKVLIVLGFAVLGIGLVFLFGWILMLLWNWLMPEIFGLTRLTYWQAWGVLILSWILFKGIKIGSDESSGRQERKRKRHLRQYMEEEESAPAESDHSPEAPRA
jgi:hypothetical protein